MLQHVRLQMAQCGRRVRANVTLEALLTLMGLIVHFAGISIREGLPAAPALERLVRCMQFLYVNPQICLTAALSRAKFAGVHRLLSYIMNEPMSFQWVGLCETHVAVLALVRFLSSVRAEVALQLERVWRRIGAMRALVRPLARVTANVAT